MSARTPVPSGAQVPAGPPADAPAGTPPSASSGPHRFATFAVPLAGLWSLGYLVLGVRWLRGGNGNPADPDVDAALLLSVLEPLGPTGGAALYTGLAATGLALAVVMVLRRPRPGRAGPADRVVAGAAVVLGVVLAVVLTDFRVLATLGYLPMLPLAAFGLLPDAELAAVLPWSNVNLVLLTAGGLAWVAAGISHGGAVNRHDPRHRRPSWTAPSAVARWGRAATGVAIIVPLGYAATRYAWALGIPFGVSPALLDELGTAVLAGAGLATGGVLGAVLTWGLLRPWGQVLPRWLPGIGGREVPVSVAVAPASLVAAAVTSAGLMFVRFKAADRFGEYFPGTEDDVAAWLPEMFWPVWGVALAAATYAYVLRRRDQPVGRTSPVS